MTTRTLNLKALAKKLSIQYKGDGDTLVHGIKDIERVIPDDLPKDNFLYFIENLKTFKRHPQIQNKGVVFTSESMAVHFKNALVAPDESIRLYFIKILQKYATTPGPFPDIPSKRHIDESSKIDQNVTIMPGVVIMQNVHIGKNCIIHPNVVIEAYSEIGENTVLHPSVVIGYNCKIGSHCTIYGGTIIGADGFGYYDHKGKNYKIPQIGNVTIEDHVDIGSNCSVDRATIESTTIGEYTKIDNQVQIGHNCQIGKNVYIAGQAGISGSVKINDQAVIAGQVGIADHINIGEGSVILARSGIMHDTKPRTVYFGTPAKPYREEHRIISSLTTLPKLLKRVKQIEDKLFKDKPERQNTSN